MKANSFLFFFFSFKFFPTLIFPFLSLFWCWSPLVTDLSEHVGFSLIFKIPCATMCLCISRY